MRACCIHTQQLSILGTKTWGSLLYVALPISLHIRSIDQSIAAGRILCLRASPYASPEQHVRRSLVRAPARKSTFKKGQIGQTAELLIGDI